MKTITIDPWTLENTMNIPNTNVFTFQQNDVRYRFNKNTISRQYEINGEYTKNPYTMKVLSPQTLVRLSRMQNLTEDELSMLEGVNLLMREFGKSYKFKNNDEIRKIKRTLANNYINDMKLLNNDYNIDYNKIKTNLIKKKRL